MSRTFIKSPLEVTTRLLDWFHDPGPRDKVTRAVLLWVNNHFNDFETNADLCKFLEDFEDELEKKVRLVGGRGNGWWEWVLVVGMSDGGGSG